MMENAVGAGRLLSLIVNSPLKLHIALHVARQNSVSVN